MKNRVRTLFATVLLSGTFAHLVAEEKSTSDQAGDSRIWIDPMGSDNNHYAWWWDTQRDDELNA